MNAPSESRSELRKKYIRAREALSPQERARKDRLAVEQAASLPEFAKASTVMLYRAVRSELSLDALPFHPSAAGKRFVYPLCTSATEMAAMLPGGWKEGPFGIPEPLASASVPVPPEEIDLVICPGSAFDRFGRRLGMGAGYYDRFLPKCTRAVVGMAAFDAQQAPSLPAAAWDFPMRLIITESGIIRPPRENDPEGGERCG